MTDSLGQQFFNDSRVESSIQNLIQLMEEYSQQLEGTRPPTEGENIHYDQYLNMIEQYRGRELFYPYLSSGLGNGPLVELADGSVKYDCIIGIGVHYLGHSHPDLIEAGIRAGLEDTVMQGNLQQNPESARLMDDLVELGSRGESRLEHCFLTSSGAMANENALKMCFQHQAPADRVLAFENSFSGRTMTLAQITDKPEYREGLPDTIDVDYVPFYDAEAPEKSTENALSRLNKHLEKHGDQYGAMVMELVQGESGFYPGSREFLEPIMSRLQDRGIPVFVDEVQSFGRTSEPFAFQHFDLESYVDVATVGKLTQTCATLYTPELNPEPGLVSQTFTSSSSAIRASRVILNELTGGEYFGPNGIISSVHDDFVDRLTTIHSNHPESLRGPYGTGAMVACTAFDGSTEKTRDFLQTLYNNGVIAFLAGDEPSRVRFLLPVGAIEREHLNEIAQRIETTIDECKGG
ncbi:MAG: aminotransferase class III-fold pyridoxal phosphate-dependent enzyme [bacterium]